MAPRYNVVAGRNRLLLTRERPVAEAGPTRSARANGERKLLTDFSKDLHMPLTIISKVRAREVVDSRRNPTVELDVELNAGARSGPVACLGYRRRRPDGESLPHAGFGVVQWSINKKSA
jgi:hypothetical protein